MQGLVPPGWCKILTSWWKDVLVVIGSEKVGICYALVETAELYIFYRFKEMKAL